VNALWPRTVIATDAINMIPGVEAAKCRTPEILADAAHAILTGTVRDFSGRFLIDDEVLRAVGITDLARYAVDPSQPLLPDLFLDEALLGGAR
jgi:citronellol/citronellal dehydrogenase